MGDEIILKLSAVLEYEFHQSREIIFQINSSVKARAQE